MFDIREAILDAAGNARTGTVSIFEEDGTTPARLFADALGATQLASHIITLSSLGEFLAFVGSGRYQAVVNATGAAAKTVSGIVRGTPEVNTLVANEYGYCGAGGNDYSVLQAAIDKLGDLSANNGLPGRLILKPGTYGLAQKLAVHSMIELIGAGMGSSIMKVLPGFTLTDPMIYNSAGDPGVGIRTDKKIRLMGLTFDGDERDFPAYDQDTNPPTYGGLSAANSRGHLVRMYSVEDLAVINCEFRNHRSNAAMVDTGGLRSVHALNKYHHNGKIDDIAPCLYVSPRAEGQTMPQDVLVFGNHFWSCDRMGMRFEVDGGIMALNLMRDMGEGGVHIHYGRDVIACLNLFSDMRVTDIVANGFEIESWPDDAGSIMVCMNMIKRMGTTGIAINGGKGVIASMNLIEDCGTDTIYPTPNGPLNYAAGRSAGDPIADTKRCGISLITADDYAVQDAVVTNNLIRDTEAGANTQYGIVMGRTGTPLLKHAHQLVKDNLISGMGLGKFFASDVGELGDNVVIENSDGVDLTRDFDLLIGDGYAVTTGSPSAALLAYVAVNSVRAIEFEDAKDQDWQWSLPPPADWRGGKVVGVTIYGVKKVTGGTGNLRLTVTAAQRTLSTNLGGGTLAGQTVTHAVEADGSATMEKIEITLATPWTWGADSHLTFRLARLALTDAADTWGNSFYVSDVTLRVRADPEGY